jgi:hypothetical protein
LNGHLTGRMLSTPERPPRSFPVPESFRSRDGCVAPSLQVSSDKRRAPHIPEDH